MESSAYVEMYDLEDTHWWFRGRRRVISSLHHRAGLPAGSRILDAGCGTGRNLVELRRLGRAKGVDPSPDAVEFCRSRGIDDVQVASVESLPFPDGSFDLVQSTDVIEHIDDDAGALRELRRVAAQGASLLLTVPAYQWMWTEHDVQLHHRRRYTAAVLTERVTAAGWEPTFTTYYNSFALPVVVAMRLTGARAGHTDLDRTPPSLNRVLEAPLRLEAAAIARGGRFPAGVSLGLLARNPEAVRS